MDPSDSPTQVPERDPDEIRRNLADGGSDGRSRCPNEHKIQKAHCVTRVSQRTEENGKTQGDRPDWKAPGELAVAIATDEEDPHAESDSAHEKSGSWLVVLG